MSDDRTVIEWTPAMLKRFKEAYRKAVNSDVETFVFDGHEFVVPYARRLIEYLDGEFRE